MSTDDSQGTTRLPDLERDEVVRYARHLVLPDVGPEGQRRLKAASALVVGAGGLGSPAALYLAAAGVGRVGLVDADSVDVSNLQRQILHGSSDLGRPKVASGRERLLDLNPHVDVVVHEERITSQNALSLCGAYDLVLDGSDNFPTRYLINDACVLNGIPVVYGAILRWDGQVSLFGAPGGPCYRCLFRDPPPPGLVPNCAEAGVFGALPGVVGATQALEALKWFLRVGEPLAGRLILFDALRTRWREIEIRRDPDCPVCGDTPTVTELIDYEHFCGLTPERVAAAGEPMEENGLSGDIDVRQLDELLTSASPPLVIDVREDWEWSAGSLADRGAVHVPLGELAARLSELRREDAIVVVCRVGARSARAALLLREEGFEAVANLRGGLLAWASEIDPELVVP